MPTPSSAEHSPSQATQLLSSQQLAQDLEFATRMAAAADAITMERFGAGDLIIDTKPDRSNVTDADRAVESALRAMITAERPSDSLLGEEFGEIHGGSRRWVIDPIDGTANFMRAVPGWATLISLEVDGVAQLGLVSSPATGTRWWATRGGGAWRSRTGQEPCQIFCSKIQQLADAWLSFQSYKQWDQAGFLPALTALSRSTWRDRAFGDSLGYMLLAEGSVDVVAEFDVKPYDLSALVTIVEEAGGRFSGVFGASGAWNSDALATNGLLHEQVLSVIAESTL